MHHGQSPLTVLEFEGNNYKDFPANIHDSWRWTSFTEAQHSLSGMSTGWNLSVDSIRVGMMPHSEVTTCCKWYVSLLCGIGVCCVQRLLVFTSCVLGDLFENNNNKSRVSPNIITWMIFNQTLTCCRRFEFPTIFSVLTPQPELNNVDMLLALTSHLGSEVQLSLVLSVLLKW